MIIQTTDAYGVFTKKLIAVYKERTVVNDFLSTFFPTKPGDITDTLELSVMAQRTQEAIADDVERGSDGNRNTFEKSTEKIFISPYFREYFDQTSMQMYEQMWRGTEVSTKGFSRVINSLADHAMELQNKIERRYELQRSQCLELGRFTMSMGAGQITFFRKAASFSDHSVSDPWSNGAVSIPNQVQEGCVWLRKNGKVNTFKFILLMGDSAASALLANTDFRARQNFFNWKPDTILPPQKNSKGGVYHGTFSAGPYEIEAWSYPDFYQDSNKVMQPYLNPKVAILMPPNPNFCTAFAAVPQLLEPGESPTTGKFMLSQYTDEKKKTREFHIESAGMPIMTAVDQVYTMTVLP